MDCFEAMARRHKLFHSGRRLEGFERWPTEEGWNGHEPLVKVCDVDQGENPGAAPGAGISTKSLFPTPVPRKKCRTSEERAILYAERR